MEGKRTCVCLCKGQENNMETFHGRRASLRAASNMRTLMMIAAGDDDDDVVVWQPENGDRI